MNRKEKTERELWDILNRELDKLPDHEGTRFSSPPHRLLESTAGDRNWAIRDNLTLGPLTSVDARKVVNLREWAYREYNLPPERP